MKLTKIKAKYLPGIRQYKINTHACRFIQALYYGKVTVEALNIAKI